MLQVLHNDSVDPILEKQRKEEQRQHTEGGQTEGATLEMGTVRGSVPPGVKKGMWDSV